MTVVMLIGLNTGYVWVVDTRVNQFLYNVKVIDAPVRNISSSASRVVIEDEKDTILHCWS